MDKDNLLKEFKGVAENLSKSVDGINKAMPFLMENLSPEEKKDLEDVLKKKDWNSINEKLSKASDMINNIPV